MTKNYKDLAIRFLKFAIVGGSGVFVNLGIYAILTRGFGLVDSLVGRNIAYAISVEISIITNFFLNDVWTFSDRRAGLAWLARFYRFHLVSFVGFGINWGVFAVLNWFLVEQGLTLIGTLSVFGWEGNVDDLLAACIGIVGAMMWNFLANLLWTWKGQAQGDSVPE